jgi:uncharacterized protein YecE (DUF72 family)
MAVSHDFDRSRLRERLALLAGNGVYVGTSSWKYPGWLGTVYDEARYLWRGKFAKSRFERDCLAEYAETFKTVCVDAAYYAFPGRDQLEGLAARVPEDFRFGFKVTDAITVKRFPDLPRFGERAGHENPGFLDGETFERRFLAPCASIRSRVGILIFEFSRFRRDDFATAGDFVSALDVFLAALPKDWPYGIELRNHDWLTPDYLACLARHQVAHVFNSWTRMPSVAQQLGLGGSRSNPKLVAARFLLAPGNLYESAIDAYAPFDAIKHVEADARAAAGALIAEGAATPQRRTYIFINNRLEGSAPRTIREVVETFTP